MFMAIAIMFGLQGCGDDPKSTVSSSDFNFKAVNLTIDDGKLTATGGTTITVNWTVNVTLDGKTTTVSGTSKSDELPVRIGDEIEISLNPSCPEQNEASFIMPDGTSRKVSIEDPSFRWIVPENFTVGMQIKGECHYETADCIYNRTGIITLVELK